MEHVSEQVTVTEDGRIVPYTDAQIGPAAASAAADVRPDAPSAQDFFATFILPPTPGEIANCAGRKDSAGRFYFGVIAGQGGSCVKVWRRDLDGSVAFLGRAWPVAGYNVAGFDLLLDPPNVLVLFPGHDLHPADPTQRNNGVMWVAIPCGVAPGDPAQAVPQEWGANIPQNVAPPPAPPPAPAPGGPTTDEIVAALGGAWMTHPPTRANYAKYFLTMLLGVFVSDNDPDPDMQKLARNRTPEQRLLRDMLAQWTEDRAFEGSTNSLKNAGLPPK